MIGSLYSIRPNLPFKKNLATLSWPTLTYKKCASNSWLFPLFSSFFHPSNAAISRQKKAWAERQQLLSPLFFSFLTGMADKTANRFLSLSLSFLQHRTLSHQSLHGIKTRRRSRCCYIAVQIEAGRAGPRVEEASFWCEGPSLTFFAPPRQCTAVWGKIQ